MNTRHKSALGELFILSINNVSVNQVEKMKN